MSANLVAWSIAALATAGVIIRPFKWPEAVWAGSGALLIVVLGLLPVAAALAAMVRGIDVYLFLTGMMLLSEVGRREGLFDWVAVIAVNHAKGSPKRLFLLVYAVGTVVTAFLSNDAAAVVLTPAVFAAATKAKTSPLPLLLVCAFIANAASFILPISNPANLVLYGNHTPPLGAWLASFALPSLTAVIATYLALYWSQRQGLNEACAADLPLVPLTVSGRVALGGIVVTAVALLVVSWFDIALGLPTAILGVLTAAMVFIQRRCAPWAVLSGISWSVLPLVAGLFVLVETLDRSGVIRGLATVLHHAAQQSVPVTAAVAGALVAIACNFMNNLPAGLIASSTLLHAHVPQRITDTLLLGVDLGPNLSITGSLATILWLNAIRRDGADVSFWAFLKVGVLVMPPALILAVACRLLMR